MVMVAMVATTQAQSVLIFENFEAGTLPAGWTRVQNTGSNGWEFGQASYTSPDWAIPAHPSGGNLYAAANDDNCNCDAGEDELISPVMDWTPFDSVAIIFDAFFDQAYDGDAYLEVSYDGGSNWITYVIPANAAWQTDIGVTLDPTTNGAFTNNTIFRFVYTDNGAWADGFAIDNVLALGFRDVCSEMLNLTCNTPVTVNLAGAGDFFWDFDECWATPGWEQVYQFTPTVTGTYHLNVTTTNGEWIDYLWKPVSLGCDTGNWVCISDVDVPSAHTLSLTAGVPIYIVADAENPTVTSTHTFELLCACSAPSMPSGTPEGEACTDSITDGCNMLVPSFGSISCGETVIGSTYADGTARDLDWYEFTVSQTTNVTLTASGGFAMNLVIFDDCTNQNVIEFDQAAACQTASITTSLTPGTYLALVGPIDFDGYACNGANSNYWLNLDMGSPTVTVDPAAISICQGTTTTLTANGLGGSAPYQYIWNTGASSQAITVGDGTYCVTLTDANGCFDDACGTVTEVAYPDADFSFTQSALAVTFTDLTSPTPDAWYWDFGDGNTAVAQNPSNNYPNVPGTYIAGLIAGVNPGCNDTAAYLVNVSAVGCAPQFLYGPDGFDNLDGFDLDTASVTSGATQYVSYTDNTGAPITVLNRNETYNLTFHGSGSDAETFAAWIDYNGNGTFEPSELLGECTSSGGSCTISFTVPLTAPLGNMTIRLIAQEDVTSGLNPCENMYEYGEAEDYTVAIEDVIISVDELTTLTLDVYPNPTEGMLNITFQTEDVNSLEVRMTNAVGQVVFTDARGFFNGVYNNTVDVSNLATGNYMLQVITEKGITNKKVIVK